MLLSLDGIERYGKFRERDAQRREQPIHHVERGRMLAALQLRHITAIHPGLMGQILLSNSLLTPKLPNALREYRRRLDA